MNLFMKRVAELERQPGGLFETDIFNNLLDLIVPSDAKDFEGYPEASTPPISVAHKSQHQLASDEP